MISIDRVGLTAGVELENPCDHDDSLRLVSSFSADKAQCRCPVDKQAATRALLLLNHLISADVLAQHEEWRP
jgi:hypothetical protein